jgi:hypothetical protein
MKCVGFVFAAVVFCCIGCTSSNKSETVAEGIILNVEYKLEDGKISGFTRKDNYDTMPSGTGNWNIDAYGKLTRDFLVITFPQKRELGPKIIPASRLIEIQFGDGGIKYINEITGSRVRDK